MDVSADTLASVITAVVAMIFLCIVVVLAYWLRHSRLRPPLDLNTRSQKRQEQNPMTEKSFTELLSEMSQIAREIVFLPPADSLPYQSRSSRGRGGLSVSRQSQRDDPRPPGSRR